VAVIGKLTYAQKKCVSLVGLCMQRTGMLRPGDRIGVAVSGGVDSFVLLKTLLLRRAIVPFPFEVMALHVNPGFSPESHQALTRWCAREGVALQEPFFEGRLQVVRPALLVEKNFIRAAARHWALPVWANDCPSNGKTRRDDMLGWLRELWARDKAFRVNTFNALTKWQLGLTSARQ